jgi:hypothetical protein
MEITNWTLIPMPVAKHPARVSDVPHRLPSGVFFAQLIV